METPKTLQEILALEDVNLKIEYLKKGRKNSHPNVEELYKAWNPTLHDIMDKGKYPKVKVLVKMAHDEFNSETGATVHFPAEYDFKEPNRIALPIEQDIVNIHTAFTVGTEPALNCTPEDEGERGVFESVKQIFKKNKLKYQNRKIVRSWLSEQEIAEYWYAVADDGFWARLKRKISNLFGNEEVPKYRIKSQIWSPFRGDKLYPFYDDSGDLLAFSREYEKKDLDGKRHKIFMTVTNDKVYQWELGKVWEENPDRSFVHKFKKLPVIYSCRNESLCKKVVTLRERLEKCLSGYADCIDNHFFPLLMLFGEIQPDSVTGDARNRMMNLLGEGADAKYLTWQQSSDPIKIEIETYFNEIYGLTNTPRISFDQLKGTGNSLSGTAFRYVFMAAHMAVQNYAEDLGPFFQRRVNFLVSAVGSLNSSLEKASNTVDIETEIIPFMIDNESDKVNTSVAAVGGGVWSLEHGVAYCSDYGERKEEIQQIIEDRKEKAKNEISQGSQAIKTA